MENSRKRTLYIVQAALIAAIYVVLTLVFKPISFDFIQVRIAEALTILPMFLPAAVPGLFLGCLIANFFDLLDKHCVRTTRDIPYFMDSLAANLIKVVFNFAIQIGWCKIGNSIIHP